MIERTGKAGAPTGDGAGVRSYRRRSASYFRAMMGGRVLFALALMACLVVLSAPLPAAAEPVSVVDDCGGCALPAEMIGNYSENGTYDGYPRYDGPNGFHIYNVSIFGARTWAISSELGSTDYNNGTIRFYLASSNPTPPLSNEYFPTNSASGTIAITDGSAPPPAAPTLTVVDPISGGSTTVYWTGVDGAVGFKLDVATDSGFTQFVSGYQGRSIDKVGTDPNPPTTHTVTGLAHNGDSYYFRVRAYNGAGESDDSNVITRATIPPTPALSAADNVTDSAFLAAWGASNGATNYGLQVCRDSGFSDCLGGYNPISLSGATTQRLVSGLAPATAYHFRVRAGNSAGASAYSAARSVTTDRAAQSIAFDPITTRTFGDPAFTLGATASSGLPVSYQSSDTGVAQISGDALTITGAGSAVITASQAGNATYYPAADVQRTLTVGKADAGVILDGLVAVFDGTPRSVSATTTPAGLSVDVTYDGDPSAPTDAGSYAVDATIMDDNYTGTTSATLEIAKATADITFGALTVTYDGDPKPVVVTTDPAGLDIDITYDGDAAPPTDAGSYSLTATVDEANYAGTASATLEIAKASADVSFDALAFTYDGDPKPATVSTSPADLNVDITYDGTGVPPTDAGDYAVTATVDAPNHQGSASDTLEIAKADQAISFPALADAQLGDPDIDPGATASSGLTVSYSSSDTEVAEIRDGLIALTGGGSVDITATQAGNDNFNAATDVVRALSVNATVAEPEFDPEPGVYDAAQSVSIATTTESAEIEYRLDSGAWTAYTGNPISLELDASVTIEARATRPNWETSSVASGEWHIYPALNLRSATGDPLPTPLVAADGDTGVFRISGGEGDYEATITRPDGSTNPLSVDCDAHCTSEWSIPTAGAFAGGHTVTITDAVTGFQTDHTITVPLAVDSDRGTLLSLDPQRNGADVLVRGAPATTEITLVVDTDAGAAGAMIEPDASVMAEDDAPAGNPARFRIALPDDWSETRNVTLSATGVDLPHGSATLLAEAASTHQGGVSATAGQPVAGARVVLLAVGDDGVAQPRVDEADVVYEAITDDQGRFTLFAPPEADDFTHALGVTAAGYAPERVDASACGPGDNACEVVLRALLTATASAGPGGSVTPGAVDLVENETASFSVTADAGYNRAASVGGDCPAGQWSDDVWTTGPMVANCTVVFGFLAATVSGDVPDEDTPGDDTLQANLAPGGGDWRFATAGDGPLETSGFIPLEGHPKSPATPPPSSFDFPYGQFAFVLMGGTPGSTAQVAVRYPSPLPEGTVYWKYGPRAERAEPHWYALPEGSGPGTVAFSPDRRTITLTLADGGLGDGDLVANGVLSDPGGPGVRNRVAVAIPTLSVWAVALLGALILLAAWRARREEY